MIGQGIEIRGEQSLIRKFFHLDWGLIFLISGVSLIGFLALYSAAGGKLDPWASRQIMRFAVGLTGMMIVAMIDIRWWHRMAYPIYGIGFLLLVMVEIMGRIGMGAQRWIDLGFIQIQPSELMKIAVVLVLARYFHAAALVDMRRLRFLVIPALLILAPVGLVLLQPNLGTALIILVDGAALLWISGAPLWLYILGIAGVAALIPALWFFYMHDYQKQRVMTFLDPESDPLGAGYHIMQSKIALGSGGINGKGFLNGSQSHLNFLPEKQTDFIFTLWAEEWGLIGGVLLLALLGLILVYCGWIAFQCRHAFGRFLAFGLMVNYSLYIFINVAMVMGLIPVVGIPLPLVSYGGTSMLASMVAFGLIMSCHLHKDAKMSRM